MLFRSYNDFWGGLLRPANGRKDVTEPKGITDEDNFYNPICPVTFGLAERLLFKLPTTRAGRFVVNEIYLNTKSGVAIISPPVQAGEGNPLQSFHAGNQPTPERPAKGKDGEPLLTGSRALASTFFRALGRLVLIAGRVGEGWNGDAADLILEATRGFVSNEDQINFLQIGPPGLSRALLIGLKARTQWNLHGLETSSDAITEEAGSREHSVFEGSIQENARSPQIAKGVDLIYLGEGIQCFADPRGHLRKVAVLLNPGGLLVLCTPNLDSDQRNLLGPAWTHWRPAEHRFIFSLKSLRLLLAQTGFSVERLTTLSPPEATAASLRGPNNPSRPECVVKPTMQKGCRRNRLPKRTIFFGINSAKEI